MIAVQAAIDMGSTGELVMLGDLDNADRIHVSHKTSSARHKTKHNRGRHISPPYTIAGGLSARRSFAKHATTSSSIINQLQQWYEYEQQDLVQPTQAVLLSLGLHDLDLGGIDKACRSNRRECQRAFAQAQHQLSRPGDDPETLRNMLTNIIFKAYVMGSVHSSRFHVYVSKYSIEQSAIEPRFRKLVMALNEVLAESVAAVNSDWGTQVATFV